MSYAEIIPGLYIGDINSPTAIGALDMVVNASNKSYSATTPTLHIENIEDIVPLFNTRQFVEKLYSKISLALTIAETANPQRLLIHCFAGMNRSALVACLWLMRRYKYSADDAIELVTRANKTRSVDTLTNPLFRQMVITYKPDETSVTTA